MANLLKFYRGAASMVAQAPVGAIWFDTENDVIKVRIATGTETDWEVYGTSPADLSALAERVATLEGDVKTIKETTIPALTQAIANALAEAKAYTDAETKRATEAEKALADRLDVIEGEGEGSIKKAVADAKAELIGDATTDGNTLGKLEDRIETLAADAKTYSVVKVTEGLGANIKEAYKLVDEDDKQVGDLIEIEKDDSLVDVVTTIDEAGNQVVKFTYNLADGTSKEVTIDLSAYVTESEYGDGLQVVDHVISVKKDATSEAFLTVGADGVKLAGVQDAINAAEAAAKKYTDDEIAALDADVISAAKYTVTTTAEDGTESTEEVDHKVRVQVVEVDGVVTDVNVTESDIASAAALATLDAEVQEHEIVVSAALNDLNARMTTAEGSVADHETRLTQAEADIDALEAALADKNVAAESTTPDYVTATAADNKVTVAATQKVIDAVALAETSVQTITSANTCLTANKSGNNVELSLVWESGSFAE